MNPSIREFAKKLSQTPPAPCDFKVGDRVSFTNDYGVTFHGHKVIGFDDDPDNLAGRFIYLDYDCYWFPCRPEELRRA